ncbi:MAG: archaeoflavoprotein AfpA [Candidatus Bathyarchaeia archaeon]
MRLKVAWGLTGSGDFMPEIIQNMRQISKEYRDLNLYIFLSKAAQKVLTYYGLERELQLITDRIFVEVDSNTTKPFYYIPGALQLRKFKFFLVCPATANTVAKIVNGIADTLITNSVSQACKANVPVFILPVDQREGSIITTLPSGDKLELEMREVDLQNTARLSKMRSIQVLKSPDDLKEIFKRFHED